MAAGFDTLVFCTSYAADPGAWQARTGRWLAHHRALPWGRALLCVIDDGSPFVPPDVVPAAPGGPLPGAAVLHAAPLFLRFADRLGRSGMRTYPGWWRSFLHAVFVAQHYGCRRIVHVESDAFVLTQRMLRFLLTRESGWTAMWCPRWGFAETAVQVVCEDRYGVMHSLWQRGWERLADRPAEQVLPFTAVAREPHGNRYGEFRERSIPGYADFAVQVTPRHAVWFR